MKKTLLEDSVVATASDHGYFPMALGLIQSIRDRSELDSMQVLMFDLGLNSEQIEQLQAINVHVVKPKGHFGLSPESMPISDLAIIIRPFIKDYLPGYQCYFWIDADAWIQDPMGLQIMHDHAMETGMAASAESDKSYTLPLWLIGWIVKNSFWGRGLLEALQLLRNPMVNAGVVALRADAPHWENWQKRFAQAIDRSKRIWPNDQFSMNHMIWVDRPSIKILGPEFNWICNRAAPAFNPAKGCFCKPYEPFEPLYILHLAGHTKTGTFNVPTPSGEKVSTKLTYSNHGAGEAMA